MTSELARDRPEATILPTVAGSVHTIADGRRRLRAIGAALGDAAGFLTDRIQETHDSISRRSFAAVGPMAMPVRVTHDAIARIAYAAVRGGVRSAGRLGGTVASVTPLAADRRLFGRRARIIEGAVCGFYGDHLQRHHPELAVRMSIRSGGRDVALERAALDDAYPKAGPRLAVFLHGLCETEDAWGRPAMDDDAPGTYGDRLRRQLGVSPLFVRYNSGLRIRDNGSRLADLLEDLVAAWPVEVEGIDLIGHSMGGLVIRSACDVGVSKRKQWVSLVRHCVYLGTPHHGAPLERGVDSLQKTLRLLPETRVIASLVDGRSAGIKDLRWGYVDQRPRRAQHKDISPVDSGVGQALLATARHHAVAASIADTPGHPLSRVIGDLLVPRASAFGDGPGGPALSLGDGDRHHLGGITHFHLLDHPTVAELLREWLGEGLPEPER